MKAKQERQRVTKNAKKKILQIKKELDDERAKVLFLEQSWSFFSDAGETQTEGAEKNDDYCPQG